MQGFLQLGQGLQSFCPHSLVKPLTSEASCSASGTSSTREATRDFVSLMRIRRRRGGGVSVIRVPKFGREALGASCRVVFSVHPSVVTVSIAALSHGSFCRACHARAHGAMRGPLQGAPRASFGSLKEISGFQLLEDTHGPGVAVSPSLNAVRFCA